METVSAGGMTMIDGKYGFIVPQSGIAANAEEAARVANRLGLPVVVKVISPDETTLKTRLSGLADHSVFILRGVVANMTTVD